MALVEDEQSAEQRRRRGGRNGGIPTAPTGPPPGSGGGSGSSGSSSGSSSSSGTSSSSASSSSGGGGSESDYRKKAGNRYLKQARNLEGQAKALKYALRHSFGDKLRAELQDINEILRAQNKSLMSGYRQRVQQLAGSVEDNERAQATQTREAQGNRLRERNAALSEIAAQGAGESDAMAAQMMSLRNWQANQGEIERSRFDTLRSINSALTDLNVDTKTGRMNLASEALADKEMLWTNYYTQRSEALTQLGNIRGQQADYRDYAKEYGVGGGGGKAARQAERAFMQAAKETGKSWDSPGISKKLMRWDGREDFNPQRAGRKAQLAMAPTVDLGDRPEGATLRKW